MSGLIIPQEYVLIYFSKLSVTSVKLSTQHIRASEPIKSKQSCELHAVLACALQVFSLLKTGNDG